MSTVTVPIHVPQLGDSRGKHWAKVVDEVDTSKSSGWAFAGEFVADGGIQDLPVGAVLLVYGEKGSRANPQAQARIYLVNDDATLSPEGEASGRAWARTLRDRVAELLTSTPHPLDLSHVDPSDNDLAVFGDHVLARELERRGWGVVPPQ